jgi:hypothetical protein
MTEYLFYSPKLLACAQVKINMLHNQTQMAGIRFSNWTYLEKFKHRSSSSRKGIQRYDVVNRIETPWWQFQFSNICSLSKNMVNGIVSIYLNLIKVI